ncbi:MAG: hypothetical protein ABH846_04660 [Patescibacteria group bacterium]
MLLGDNVFHRCPMLYTIRALADECKLQLERPDPERPNIFVDRTNLWADNERVPVLFERTKHGLAFILPPSYHDGLLLPGGTRKVLIYFLLEMTITDPRLINGLAPTRLGVVWSPGYSLSIQLRDYQGCPVATILATTASYGMAMKLVEAIHSGQDVVEMYHSYLRYLANREPDDDSEDLRLQTLIDERLAKLEEQQRQQKMPAKARRAVGNAEARVVNQTRRILEPEIVRQLEPGIYHKSGCAARVYCENDDLIVQLRGPESKIKSFFGLLIGNKLKPKSTIPADKQKPF